MKEREKRDHGGRRSEDACQKTEVSLWPIGAYAPVGGQRSEIEGVTMIRP
jgi:hypothetical protein